jgi:hypothetical protein
MVVYAGTSMFLQARTRLPGQGTKKEKNENTNTSWRAAFVFLI